MIDVVLCLLVLSVNVVQVIQGFALDRLNRRVQTLEIERAIYAALRESFNSRKISMQDQNSTDIK